MSTPPCDANSVPSSGGAVTRIDVYRSAASGSAAWRFTARMNTPAVVALLYPPYLGSAVNA